MLGAIEAGGTKMVVAIGDDDYIVPAGLGGEQGIKGALYLAKQIAP